MDQYIHNKLLVDRIVCLARDRKWFNCDDTSLMRQVSYNWVTENSIVIYPYALNHLERIVEIAGKIKNHTFLKNNEDKKNGVIIKFLLEIIQANIPEVFHEEYKNTYLKIENKKDTFSILIQQDPKDIIID